MRDEVGLDADQTGLVHREVRLDDVVDEIHRLAARAAAVVVPVAVHRAVGGLTCSLEARTPAAVHPAIERLGPGEVGAVAALSTTLALGHDGLADRVGHVGLVREQHVRLAQPGIDVDVDVSGGNGVRLAGHEDDEHEQCAQSSDECP